MVVTAGTLHRQTKQAAACDIERVVQHPVIDKRNVALGFMAFILSVAEKPGGDQFFADFWGEHPRAPPIHHLVARDLLADELIVGHIVVEGSDDIIAIAPFAFALNDERGIDVEANGVGITGHIEPVPGPALAEARRRQQTIEHTLECIRTIVRKKGIHFFDRGR